MKLRQQPKRIVLAALASALGFVPCLTAQEIFWNEGGGSAGATILIRGANIDGSSAQTLYEHQLSNGAHIVDFETTDTHLYWSTHNDGEVWRAELSDIEGTAAPILAASDGLGSPHGMTIDSMNGKLYFADRDKGIFSAALDGGSLTNLYPGNNPPAFFDYTAVVPRGDSELIWTATNTKFLYLQPAGVATEQPFIVEMTGAPATYGLAYHAGSDTVYYTNITDGTLRSYNLLTGEDKLLRRDLHQPLGLKLSPSGTHLLIAERGLGISAFQIDNFGYQLLVEAPLAHFGVAVTADPAPLPPGIDLGTLPYLFAADFENDVPETPPGPPISVGTPGSGEAVVAVDSANNVFRRGADNQYYRAVGVSGYSMNVTFDPSEVITLSFDYVGRVNPGDANNWININFHHDGAIVHRLSLRNQAANIRADGVSYPYGGNNRIIRFDTVMNNSTDTIEYGTPDGGTKALGPGLASLWLYHYDTAEWQNVVEEYVYAIEGTPVPGTRLSRVEFRPNAPMSFDLDNVYVFKGAAVGDLFENVTFPDPPGPLPEAWSVYVGEPGYTYLTTGNRNRGAALHPDEEVLVVSRTIGPVGLLDPATGANLGTLNLEGVEGGTFLINEMAFDEAGVLYATNTTLDTIGASGPLKIYRWTDLSAPPKLVVNAAINSSDPVGTNRRFGDSLVVRGSGQDTELFLGSWAGTVFARLTPNGTNGDNQFDVQILPVSSISGGNLRDLTLGPNGNLGAATPAGFLEIAFDANAGTASLVATYVMPGTLEPAVYSPEHNLFAGIDINTGAFYIVDGSSLDPIYLNQFATSIKPQNPHGQVLFGAETVYGLYTENGIMALSLVPDSGELTFEEWIAGFALPEGEDGPADNPSGDGIPNFLKFALGLDPSVPARDGLPSVGTGTFTVDEVEGEYLTLTFTKPDAVESVVYDVQVAAELGEWSSGGVLVDSFSNGDGTSTHVYRDAVPVDGSSRRFMRLHVTESIID